MNDGMGYSVDVSDSKVDWQVEQWKKEQASRFCSADVCLRQSVNQLYNNQNMAKRVLFSTACGSRFIAYMISQVRWANIDLSTRIEAFGGI